MQFCFVKSVSFKHKNGYIDILDNHTLILPVKNFISMETSRLYLHFFKDSNLTSPHLGKTRKQNKVIFCYFYIIVMELLSLNKYFRNFLHNKLCHLLQRVCHRATNNKEITGFSELVLNKYF